MRPFQAFSCLHRAVIDRLLHPTADCEHLDLEQTNCTDRTGYEILRSLCGVADNFCLQLLYQHSHKKAFNRTERDTFVNVLAANCIKSATANRLCGELNALSKEYVVK